MVSKSQQFMRKYRLRNPKFVQKNKDSIYVKRTIQREIERIEKVIIGIYTRTMFATVKRNKFAQQCVLALDELGYDTGELWNQVMKER